MSFGVEEYPPGKGNLTYGSYLKIQELTSLQHCLSSPKHHDELLFIVIHQVYELWFKLLLHELDAVRQCLDSERLHQSIHLLGRCAEVMRILVAQITVLETMKPMDFLEFRDRLKPASGFQSAQFRELEFLCGIKDASKLVNFEAGSAELARLETRLPEPSIREAFQGLLNRKGFHILPGAAMSDEQLSELARIFKAPEEHYELFLLAERLLDFDEQLSAWRERHVTMVERMIGDKEGTGGSAGASYLRSTLNKRCFPELWSVRNVLNQQS